MQAVAKMLALSSRKAVDVVFPALAMTRNSATLVASLLLDLLSHAAALSHRLQTAVTAFRGAFVCIDLPCACYAAAVFEKLGAEEAKMGGASVPGFLRTHPLTEDRVKNVKKQLPAASLVYEASDCEESRKHVLDSIFGPRSLVVRE